MTTFVLRRLQETEFVIRPFRNGAVRALAGYEGCQCGGCDDARWRETTHAGVRHMDRAVQDLQAAFTLLGIDPIDLPSGSESA